MAFVVLLWDTLLKPTNKGVLVGMSLAGVLVALGMTMHRWMGLGDAPTALFSGTLMVDKFGLFFNVLLLSVAALVLMISKEFLDREEIHIGEFHSLLLFALSGMMLLTMANDLMMMFIGIEVMSIPVYVLAAFNRSSYRCIESALKYFILGSFAAGFLLYGIALIYGFTGSTNLATIQTALSASKDPTLLLGMGLLMVGFAFKVGAVPFHMWAPDVYEGAATPVTAAMATGVKVASFAALIRVVVSLAPALAGAETIMVVIAGASMIVGNIGAIRQDNVKRMLAYSGIAHTGYLFAGLLAVKGTGGMNQTAVGALSFYLACYVFMNIGAFAVMIMVGKKEHEPVLVSDWAGLGFKYPMLGAAMTLFLLSMGGLPPTAGFFGKFYLFSEIVGAGYVFLIILAVLTSAISFFYYLRVVVQMYMHEGQGTWTPSRSGLATTAIAIAVIATILFGVLPSGPLAVLDWARASVLALK